MNTDTTNIRNDANTLKGFDKCRTPLQPAQHLLHKANEASHYWTAGRWQSPSGTDCDTGLIN